MVLVGETNISDPWMSISASYLVLWEDYLRGRRGQSFRLCGSPQTGSGPLPHQTCPLYCKTALQTENRRQSVGAIETQMDLVKHHHK